VDLALTGAGANLSPHIAADHGSAAGELAACLRGVGLADRRDLGLLAIGGPPSVLRQSARLLAGVELCAGGAAALPCGWLCRTQEEMVVLGQPAATARTAALLAAHVAWAHALRVRSLAEEVVAIGLIGLRLPELLCALGPLAHGQTLRTLAPFTSTRLAGVDALLLLQSDRRALALVAAEHATRVWERAERALRGLGGSLVGLDAARRFELLDRLH
jgi:hypothetical protein